MESFRGERKEIGCLAKVDFWKAKLAERFDPEGHKNPWRGAEVGGAFRSIGLERIQVKVWWISNK
jgi:hypothetical protein